MTERQPTVAEVMSEAYNKLIPNTSDNSIIDTLRVAFPAEFECDIDDPTDRRETTLESAVEALWDPDDRPVEVFLNDVGEELIRQHDKLISPDEQQLASAYVLYKIGMSLKGEIPLDATQWKEIYSDHFSK